MPQAAFQTYDRPLERRVADLELKLIEVASRANLAWDAELRRAKAQNDFWWNAFRAVAIAQIGLVYGILIFGRH